MVMVWVPPSSSLLVPTSAYPIARRSRGFFQHAGIHRHFAQPLASRRKNRIGHRRKNCRCSGFSHSAWWLRTLNKMDLDRRRLVHAKDRVGVEVRLFYATILERDLAVKRGRGTEDDSALDLRLNRVGIDDGAAIYRADHASNASRA